MIRDFWLSLLLDLILMETDAGMPLPAMPPKYKLDQLEPFHANLLFNPPN
jgi:hypothetical protein